MKKFFADTFYFVALLSPSDQAHEQARKLTTSLEGGIVTTAWILTELANSLSHHDQRAGFVRMLHTLRADPQVTILGPNVATFEAGVKPYSSRADKDWSLTDCISFTVMEDRGISDALTGDHHFEQAGFVALLK